MGRAEIKKKFDEIVDFAEVEKFLDTPVKHYSSGMYVRLAFAVAAHLEPEILIVDEVLAVGDAAFQKKCLGKMEDVAEKEGRTVLFVSHNLSVILGLCPSSILLKSGILLSKDKSTKIIDQYTAFTRKESTTNLSSLKHTGNQTYSKLSQISMYNNKLEPSSSFPMGSSLIVDILVEIKKEVNELELGIKVSSKLGVPLHYLTSTWDGYNWNLRKGYFKFRMVMKEIMLLPGHYIISAWSSQRGQWSDDNVQDITQIEVLAKDITGFSPNFEKYVTSGCETYTQTTWEIHKLDEVADVRG
jgi:lipopolysaccharide transport system ATP-binding protein